MAGEICWQARRDFGREVNGLDLEASVMLR